MDRNAQLHFFLFSLILIYLSIYGFIAQSVEQRTENPCVAGSIPAGATIIVSKINAFNISVDFLSIDFCP